ncbi:hypothetical protein OG497_37945 [Streptomyces sp. NBC_01242]|uniref:hypothetical protein n=1 Tax=Streptomyces sp. NBC_01242 TaxID=2903795 RepID=UPI00225667E6|nr:hypothetical protein [Streptomyces sp. NBC_01242]MCX4799642.1 hypothetical protein [Streptomyces sp. NBC_01242]
MDPRPLPPPIKPRTLKRASYGYVTTDNRFEITPAYSPTLQRGSASRPSYWIVKDTTGKQKDRDYLTLDVVREHYCAPGGKVPWLVCDMDDGVVRVEPSRAAAVKWACLHNDGKVISRDPQGEGWYDYAIGPDRDDAVGVWIARADVVHRHGFDPAQEPWYPYLDAPHEPGPRAVRTDDER